MSCEIKTDTDGNISIACGVNNNKLGAKVDNPESVVFDDMDIVDVFCEGYLKKYICGEISLKQIYDDIKKVKGNEFCTITVLASNPMSGTVYQYGNYGDYWVVYGKLMGYA